MEPKVVKYNAIKKSKILSNANPSAREKEVVEIMYAMKCAVNIEIHLLLITTLVS